jgi:hypothetical protein
LLEKGEGLPVWGDGGWENPPEYNGQVIQGPDYNGLVIGVLPQGGCPKVVAC